MPVPDSPGRLSRRLARDDAYDALLNAILSGQFEPGERLVESELQSWLDMSRTPIREALNRLASDGLVVIRPQSGTSVAKIDHDHFAKCLSVYFMLLRETVVVADSRLEESDRTLLRDLKGKLLASPSSLQDASEDNAFDPVVRLLLTRAQNKVITNLMRRMTPELQWQFRASSGELDFRGLDTALDELFEGFEEHRSSEEWTQLFDRIFSTFPALLGSLKPKEG